VCDLGATGAPPIFKIKIFPILRLQLGGERRAAVVELATVPQSKTSSLLCSLAESSFFSSSALKPVSAEVVCKATPCGILSEQVRLAGLGASSHHDAVLKIAIRFLRSLTEGVSRAPPGGMSGNGDI
jgi:hypothetical protein